MEITEKGTSSVVGDHKTETKTYHDMLADLVQSCKARRYVFNKCAFLRLSLRILPRKTHAVSNWHGE
jgi:hypothetical protein